MITRSHIKCLVTIALLAVMVVPALATAQEAQRNAVEIYIDLQGVEKDSDIAGALEELTAFELHTIPRSLPRELLERRRTSHTKAWVSGPNYISLGKLKLQPIKQEELELMGFSFGGEVLGETFFHKRITRRHEKTNTLYAGLIDRETLLYANHRETFLTYYRGALEGNDPFYSDTELSERFKTLISLGAQYIKKNKVNVGPIENLDFWAAAIVTPMEAKMEIGLDRGETTFVQFEEMQGWQMFEEYYGEPKEIEEFEEGALIARQYTYSLRQLKKNRQEFDRKLKEARE